MLNVVQHLGLSIWEILKRPMKRVQGMVQDDWKRNFKHVWIVFW